MIIGECQCQNLVFNHLKTVQNLNSCLSSLMKYPYKKYVFYNSYNVKGQTNKVLYYEVH